MQFHCCVYLKVLNFKYSEMLRMHQFTLLQDPLWEFPVSVACLTNLSWLMVPQSGRKVLNFLSVTTSGFLPSSAADFFQNETFTKHALNHMHWCVWEFIVKQNTALTEFLPSVFIHAALVELFWFLLKHGMLEAMIVPRLCILLVSLGQGTCLQCIQEPHGLLCPAAYPGDMPLADIQVVEVPQEDQGSYLSVEESSAQSSWVGSSSL